MIDKDTSLKYSIDIERYIDTLIERNSKMGLRY